MKSQLLGAVSAGLFAFTTLPANAELIDNGGGLIYDTVLDITWAQPDPGDGTWEDANTWAAGLTLGGVSGWRLPYISVAAGEGPFTDSPVDCSTAIEFACRDNELGYMFYQNLSGTFGQSILTSGDPDLALFPTLLALQYWSGTELSLSDAWAFDFSIGLGDNTNQSLSNASWAVHEGNVGGVFDLTGTVQDQGGAPLCSLTLASGQFMFTCNPNGPYELLDLPTETDGTVKRQVYVDGFFPNIETLTGSTNETVVMTRASNCPDYNSFPEPGVFPDSAGKRIDVSGTVLLQNTQTAVCAMVLGNGQFGFTCDGTGTYSANIPLDNNGQYKLQVYADGFAPMVQRFDEFTPNVEARLARAVECQ